MIIYNIDEYISTHVKLKRDFKIRKSANYVEFVTADGQKLYYNKSNKFTKGLYLFRMVKLDIQNYLEEFGSVEVYDELPVNYSNEDYNKKHPTIGMDINNAYWSIAYLKGYISENTYLKGISDKTFKPIRLSALSSLGKERCYKVYKSGEYVGDEIAKYDKDLQDIYNDIRFTTYAVMRECADALKKDFCCWKTDCIMFKDTDENKTIVADIIEGYGLEWKLE